MTDQFRVSSFWMVVAILGLCTLALALYRVWPIVFPMISQPFPADPACDLRVGACRTVVAPGQSIILELQPRDIPVLQPLEVTVSLEGLNAHQIAVDFAGVDMNMGFNRIELSGHDQGRYQGVATLPMCVRSRMDWEARVLAETDRGLIAAAYRFTTGAPH